MVVTINPNGRPTDIKVLKTLGHGLDQKAIDAVRTWRFNPVIGPDGERATVRQIVEVTFNLNRLAFTKPLGILVGFSLES